MSKKLIIHRDVDFAEMQDQRLLINFQLSPEERMNKAFQLIQLSALFKKGAIKDPQGLGIVLKRKK